MKKWNRLQGCNIDSFLKDTSFSMSTLEVWTTKNGKAIYHMDLGCDSNRLHVGHIFLDDEYKVVKVIFFDDEYNHTQILEPKGSLLDSAIERIKLMPRREVQKVKPPTGATERVRCHFCKREAIVTLFDDDEDWVNLGSGVYYIGWTPWVKVSDDVEVIVCPHCDDKIEVNCDGGYEVMNI